MYNIIAAIPKYLQKIFLKEIHNISNVSYTFVNSFFLAPSLTAQKYTYFKAIKFRFCNRIEISANQKIYIVAHKLFHWHKQNLHKSHSITMKVNV